MSTLKRVDVAPNLTSSHSRHVDIVEDRNLNCVAYKPSFMKIGYIYR